MNVIISLRDKDYGELMDFKTELAKFFYSIRPNVWAFILHDMDYNEDGSQKTPHVHIYVEYAKVARLSTRLNEMAKLLGLNPMAISIEKAMSEEGSMQYLIHKNAPEKYQYDISEIVSNMEEEELRLVLQRPAETFNVDFILDSYRKSRNHVDFVKRIGLERYRLYRNVIKDLIESR